MGLKINEALSTLNGGVIASGAILKFDMNFSASSYDVSYGLHLYRSQADFDAGKSTIRKVEEFPMYYSREFTIEEYGVLTPLKAHEYLQSWVLDQLGLTDETKVEIEL